MRILLSVTERLVAAEPVGPRISQLSIQLGLLRGGTKLLLGFFDSSSFRSDESHIDLKRSQCIVGEGTVHPMRLAA